MNYFQRRKILKSISTTDLIPIRVHGHEIVDEKVVILAPKFKSKWMHILFPRTTQLFYRIKLDVLGSVTWESISGDRTVAEISICVQKILNNKSQSFDEADSRVAKFMTLLYDWKYITFRQIQ
jgi:hypothetical protein